MSVEETVTEKEKPVVKETQTVIQATGRRKESIAQIRVLPGNGEIEVNGKPLTEYFRQNSHQTVVKEPLEATKLSNRFRLVIRVIGGGLSGQAGAVRHAIARALVKTDASLRSLLRRGGFLTRDPRMKERKKYGQKGARKRFQWTKR